MAFNSLKVSNVAVYSEEKEGMKDQLCTLLITFSDGGDPTKQVTTTHTFVSTDPRHYPQQRTIGWSKFNDKDVDEKDEKRPRVTTVFRSAQTPLGKIGEDMIEQERQPNNYHLKPTQYSSSSPKPAKRTVREVNVSYETKQPTVRKGLPRTDPTKVEESSRIVDQYNQQRHVQRLPQQAGISISSSPQTVPLRVADKVEVLNSKAKKESESRSEQKKHLSKSTEKLSGTGVVKSSKMPPPYNHHAHSYEAIQESYERNNQHTQISYERQVSEYKSKSSSPPTVKFPGLQSSASTDQRRLPRTAANIDDKGFHLYTRYDDANRRPTPQPSRSEDNREGRKKKGGQYIREEFHTEEHYVITRTPMTKNGETKFPAAEQQTQELKVDIEEKKPPRVEQETRQMRFIDYNEYENEVQRLQQEAARDAKRSRSQPASVSPPSLVPLTPAIVLPAPRKQDTAQQSQKSKSEKDLTTYYSRTTETRDHISRSPLPRVSPTPVNTPVKAQRDFPHETDEQQRIRELAAESFQEKIEILKTSKRFRPSGSPHSDSLVTGGSPSPRHFSPATTRRADSSQHSDTYSSPAPHTVTSFPVTPLPDYTRETPPLSSSTPPPQQTRSSSGVRGVLTKEVTHEFITDIIEERHTGRVPDQRTTTVFPIHDDKVPVVEPKHVASTEERSVTEEIVESREILPSPLISHSTDPDDQRYLESLRQNLSYEEQVELEIQRRRRRGENDEMQPELLSVVDEEEELGLHEERPIQSPLREEETRTFEENTVITTKRIYIDTIRDAYLGPLQLLGRDHELKYLEFEPRDRLRVVEHRTIGTQQDSALPKAEEDESRFEEKIETEIRRRMAEIGDRTRAPTYYEPKKFDAEKPTTEKSSSTQQKTVTTTTTTTTTKTSTDELKPSNYYYPVTPSPLPRMEARTEYRSNIASRANFSRPQRTMSPIGSQGFNTTSNSRVLKILTESSSVAGSGFSPYGGSSAATTIRDTREREKKEMSDLNDRLASYIEKVRFLEAQNRKLATDLAYLQNRWGQDSSSVRDIYEGDLKQAKRVLDEAEKLKRDLLEELRTLQEDINAYRRNYDEAVRLRELSKEQLDELLVKLSAVESELNLLKRRITNLEGDVGLIKRENQHLITSLQRARTDLDQETLNRIDFQNQAQTLLEEIEFLRRAHDSEIRDMQAMISRDTTSENREYFKNELAAAIREIRAEYDQLTNSNRTDMESWYKLKVQEIQTQSTRFNMEQGYAAEEIKRLRSQLSDLRGKLADLEGRNAILEKNLEELNFQLEDDQRNYESALNDRDTQIRKIRDECQMLMVELQMLLDTKQTLDAEIAIYRKMLEGEEDRAGLRQLVEQVYRTHHHRHADESESVRVLRGETSSRHSYQRSAKGNVSILEASPDGRYIILENTHRSRDEHIGNWKLKRRIDNRRDIVYTFPSDFVLAAGKQVRVWARNQGVLSPPEQLIFNDEDSFGVGNNVQTILYNTQGEERATLNQRSSQS